MSVRLEKPRGTPLLFFIYYYYYLQREITGEKGSIRKDWEMNRIVVSDVKLTENQ